MSYTSWSVVFGEQPSAAKWNILGTNDAHFYSFLGDNTAWQSWTPTFTNWTIGTGGSAGTSAVYAQIGKVVHYRIKSTLGTSGSSVGSNPYFTLPVAMATGYDNSMIGECIALDQPPGHYPGFILEATNLSQAGKAQMTTIASPGVGPSIIQGFSSTAPFNWTAGDSFRGQGVYEAA